ncbi:FtsX-like permease family protein [Plantactinospora sp. WMMB334]|uniref:FtsX-like permease family protein n=1 Tax=Plantactinospora sp. WMMB334 TaxID=3404119 RepID=UPI003B922B64
MSRRRVPGWTADLALGARLVFAGGRNGLFRTLMTAVGVGLGVALLLTTTAIPGMLGARSERTSARDDQFYGVPQPPAGDGTLLVADVDTVFRDVPIRGRLLQPDGAHPPVPPGLTALPRPGELLVSPALARLLDSPEGALLRPRLDHPVVGTIADAGLAGPNEYAFYLGGERLRPGDDVMRIDHFGSEDDREGLDPVLTLLVLIIFVVLLLPIAVFVAAAVRFGGESRDRRLAALRLVGADTAMARRIAAGEALVGALLGLLAGAIFFLSGRQLVELVTVRQISVFAGDVRPVPVLVALIALAVPVTAIAVTQLALRRVAIEPLGVVRRAATRRRRLWWRLALPAAGAVLLLPMLGRIDQSGGTFNQAQVVGGVLLILVGVTALLPWLVEAVVGRLAGGAVSWQLALRRLQLDGESSGRMVSGVAVAVAGGIALQMLFAGIQHDYVRLTGQDPTRAQAMVVTPRSLDPAGAGEFVDRFRSIDGVRTVVAILDTSMTAVDAPRGPDGYRPSTLLRIGDCAALRELATLDRCADGDVFAARDEETAAADPTPLPRAGQQVEIGDEAAMAARWTVPGGIRPVTARPDPGGSLMTAVLATPGAVELSRLDGLTARTRIYLGLDPTRPETIELVRNAAISPGTPGVRVQELSATEEVDRFGEIRRGLYIGVVATLLLLGASLLVGILEQLRDRRRSLAVLVAFGTRRSTLSWSVLWQTAVPVLLGLALAIVLGAALGGILLTMVRQTVRLDWSSIGIMSGLATAMVLLVTAAGLPALWRLLRPGGLRSE